MLSVKCWLAKGPLKACKNKPPWSNHNDNQTNRVKLGNTYLKNSLKKYLNNNIISKSTTKLTGVGL